jgi:hypothetical protein
MQPYEPAEDAIEAAPAEIWATPINNDRLIRYGIKLADPHGLERWRADVEAQERRFEKERAARAQREAQIRRQQETFSQDQVAVLGQVVADVRHQMKSQISDGICAMREENERTLERADEKIADAIDKLRQEFLAVNKVIDLPSPLIRKVRDVA